VAAGSTLVISGAIAAAPGVTVSKSGSGTLAVSNLRAEGLNISDGTVAATPNGSSAGTSRVASLNITSGRFDLSDNKLIVNGGDIAALTNLIQTGRNGGNWSGNGIITSQTTATTSSLTSIGIATAQQVEALPNASATAVFSGQTVTGSDALVMYTYGGDANLDGKINVDDYGHIDTSIPLGISGWFNGDFNYDGKVNVDDYGIIDFNIGIQGTPFSTGSAASDGLSAVPEPAMLPLLLTSAALCWSRKRRRPQ
jgi:hypothetical protein